jgi:hypothetical protein
MTDISLNLNNSDEALLLLPTSTNINFTKWDDVYIS